jgi:hypothetical protein
MGESLQLSLSIDSVVGGRRIPRRELLSCERDRGVEGNILQSEIARVRARVHPRSRSDPGQTEVLRCDRFNRFGNRKRYFVLQNARKYLEIHACSAGTLVIFRC